MIIMMTVSQQILDLFEEYLESKGIEIDNPERANDDNTAQLYGTEYGMLQDAIDEILNNNY
jgi:hypothetical protein